MKFILSMVILCSSLPALAECYSFYNGVGPSKVGSVLLKRSASKVCFNTTATYENVEFFDYNKGLVAQAEATIRRERSPLGEIKADLAMGNADGLVEDFRGVSVTVKRGQVDAPVGTVREILVGKKSFYGSISK